MNEQKFEWVCPRQGCRKPIKAFTENGMKALRDQHIDQHMREDRATEINRINGSAQKPEKPSETAISVFRQRDYDILELTRVDLGFLKTRGIALDDNIILDLEPGEPNDKYN